MSNFISKQCEGEKCSLCGEPATKKIAEVVFDDDPIRNRHELTAYVCESHFRMIMGGGLLNKS